MSIKFKKTYKLSNENIDINSEKIQDFCLSLGMDKRDIARNRLSAEEYLLDWLEDYNLLRGSMSDGLEESSLEAMSDLPSGTFDIAAENDTASGVDREQDEAYFISNEDELARSEIRSAADELNSVSKEKGKFSLDELSKVTLVMGKSLERYFFRLERRGESQKPGIDSRNAGTFSESVLVGLDLKPQYTYKNRTNILTFKVDKKKKNPLVVIAEVIVAAIIVGLLLNTLLPADVAQVLLDSVLTPIYKMLFRLLSCISGPLVLLSVMWGVYGIGDTTMLGKIGKRLVFTYLGIVFSVAAVASVTFPLFGNKLSSAQTQGSQVGTLFEMILDIVPSNIIEPFLNGNTLQIIFVAFVVGIAMLFLGKKVTVVAEVIEQINYIVQFLLDLISRLIPFFIFVIVVRMIMSGTFSVLSTLWKLVIIFLCAVIILSATVTTVTCTRFKVDPRIILRKSLPTFLISITTASSAAAFGSNMETCERRFGIEPSIASFGIPLGMVMCKTATVIYYMTMSFFFCKIYGVEGSISWIIMAIIVSGLLAVATPPIPGGGVVAYTVLFSQLGIPEEALAVALSIDIIFDFVRTAVNMYNLPLILLNISSRVGMQDTAILRKEKK